MTRTTNLGVVNTITGMRRYDAGHDGPQEQGRYLRLIQWEQPFNVGFQEEYDCMKDLKNEIFRCRNLPWRVNLSQTDQSRGEDFGHCCLLLGRAVEEALALPGRGSEAMEGAS
jgi:hypothetical protein